MARLPPMSLRVTVGAAPAKDLQWYGIMGMGGRPSSWAEKKARSGTSEKPQPTPTAARLSDCRLGASAAVLGALGGAQQCEV